MTLKTLRKQIVLKSIRDNTCVIKINITAKQRNDKYTSNGNPDRRCCPDDHLPIWWILQILPLPTPTSLPSPVTPPPTNQSPNDNACNTATSNLQTTMSQTSHHLNVIDSASIGDFSCAILNDGIASPPPTPNMMRPITPPAMTT